MAVKYYNTNDNSSNFNPQVSGSLDGSYIYQSNNILDVAYIDANSLNAIDFSYMKDKPQIESTYPLFSKKGEYMGSITFKIGGEKVLHILDGFSESDWKSQPIPYFYSESLVTDR